ncbi:flagellar hook assembly protein FlgD [Alkalihalobacillus sp. AL-G]|uniref:flagellar hook assembly protein FlgD n=1 Tax=Alkalihalobacillus sp. AL-G TaxID=2926399 RepID=UPI00272A8FAB|nr:flagellar hook assembly protein FlgD [Alkalihalobacillus sp. AL-G]WLD95157.1 flagellar hook assembly protein FlgD [Alkalihalobacillus sp. AL-G]
MDTKIDQSLFLPDSKPVKQTGNTSLGKDDFLKLLIAQLSNQDPLKPMEDKEFIAQMASFSSLEQMYNMNETLTSWVAHQNNGQLLQYSELINKEVTYTHSVENDDGTTKETTETGTVTKIHFENGETTIELTDGTKVKPNEIITLSA